MPTYPFAAKRLCVDTGYFETYNRDNVTLVDLRERSIEAVVEHGVRMADGAVIELDVLIFATGFDAVTGALMRVDPIGRGGLTIREKWGEQRRRLPRRDGLRLPEPVPDQRAGQPLAALQHGPRDRASRRLDRRTRSRSSASTVTARSRRSRRRSGSGARWSTRSAAQTVYPKVDSWYMGSNVPGKARTLLAWAGGGPRVLRARAGSRRQRLRRLPLRGRGASRELERS